MLSIPSVSLLLLLMQIDFIHDFYNCDFLLLNGSMLIMLLLRIRMLSEALERGA